MRFSIFLTEKVNLILMNLFAAIALTVFLKLVGLQSGEVEVILICWVFLVAVVFGGEYWKLKKKYEEMEGRLSHLEEKYLICELLEKPSNQMEAFYREMLRAGNKAMLEEVNVARESLHDYKEYIEEWIHEVKTPITAIDLICKNHPTEETKRIQEEVRHIEALVEQTLYYARSEVVEKDYFIKETKLFSIVYPVVMEFRTVLLEQQIQIVIDETDELVFTDAKWVQFILKQLLSNAVKYAKKENAKIRIYSEPAEKGVCLVVEDNGVGIPKSELDRVCEKGFTGKNRAKKKATGMGLYLTKRLCDKLGIRLWLASEEGKYTKVGLQFCK